MANCVVCQAEFPDERLEFYNTCIGCTDQSKYAGFMSFSHKTAPEIVLVRQNKSNQESLRLANRVNRRSR